MVAKALREGRLQKLPCTRCESADSLAHHDDYDMPLDVVWLCRSHHIARHKELGWGVIGKPHPEAISGGMQIRISDDLLGKLRLMAAQECVSVARLVNRLIAEGISARLKSAPMPAHHS